MAPVRLIAFPTWQRDLCGTRENGDGVYFLQIVAPFEQSANGTPQTMQELIAMQKEDPQKWCRCIKQSIDAGLKCSSCSSRAGRWQRSTAMAT